MAVKLIATMQNFIGLSGDSKPTSPPVGSTFYETDTKVNYTYDGSAWKTKIIGWTISGEKGVATTVIKATAGILHGFLIETDGTNNVTVQLYNHASTATNPITPSVVIAGGDRFGGALGIDAICSNGIVLVLSGTNGVATVFYS